MNTASLYKSDGFECGLVFQSLRNKARLRQQDIATMVGVSVTTVQYWESGTTYPKIHTLKKLLETYLRFEVFGSGRELLEAEELWEKVRLEAPRLNVLFDRQWFGELLARVARDQQLRASPTGSLPSVPNNLPGRLTSFIGRYKERTLLTGWLRPVATPPSVRLVTLSGEGGCGKTSLALEVARELLNSYGQGLWLVELAPLSTATGVTQILAATFGLKEQAGSPLLATITNYLREKRILLVLDNCEHLVEECARVVDSLLRDCPQIVVLATSREILRVSGESVFRVPSLSLPPASSATTSNGTSSDLADDLLEYEAVQLFVERGKSASLHFALTAQNQALVAQLCRRLDGIPLAIELAAARLRVLDVFEINERLADRFRLLKGGSDRTVLPRHQTLRATVDWSHDLLNEEEKLLFRRLGVFAGGCTLKAVEEMCAFDELSQLAVLDLLQELVDKSMVAIQPTTEPQQEVRYIMLDTIHEYSRQQLSQHEREEKTAHERYLHYFTAFTAEYAPKVEGPQAEIALSLLDADYNNIRKCLQWSVTPSEIKNDTSQAEFQTRLSMGLELGKLLKSYYDIRGYQTEGREVLLKLLYQAKKIGLAKTASYAWVLFTQGFLIAHLSEYKASQTLVEEALRIFEELGDKLGEAGALTLLGYILTYTGKLDSAIQYLDKGLALSRELDDKPGVASTLANFAFTYNLSTHNSLKTAAHYYEESLALWRILENSPGIGNCLLGLGLTAYRQGEIELSILYLEESLLYAHKVGNKLAYADALRRLGLIVFHQHHYSKCINYIQQAIDVYQELGNKRGVAQSIATLGLVAQDREDFVLACNYYYEALVIARQLEDEDTIGVCLGNLGLVALKQSEYDSAGSYFKESVYYYKLAGHSLYQVNNLVAFSNLALQQAQSLDPCSLRQHLLARAVRLGGAIDAYLASTSTIIAEPEGSLHRDTLEKLRELLNEDDYQKAYGEGQTLTYEEGIEYAVSDNF